jgi:hypothetical protein
VKLGYTGRFELESLTIGPENFSLGPIGIQDFKIDYRNGVWKGQVRICVAPQICVDAVPEPGSFPERGIEIRPDGFRVYADVTFQDPGLKLFPGVFLNRIGAGLAEPPLRFFGGATVTAAGIYEAVGGLVFAFPSTAAPYRLEQDRNTIGNNFAPQHYQRAFTATSRSAAGWTPTSSACSRSAA